LSKQKYLAGDVSSSSSCSTIFIILVRSRTDRCT
jgi:hypothetical protein